MENKEVEVIDPDIETAPDAGGIVEVPSKAGIDDLVYLGDNISRVIEAQNKIRLAVLKLAQPGDWVTFGDNGNKKAELGFAGALRIGSTLGTSFTNWTAVKETGSDEIGSWFRWEYECDAIFRGRTIRVYGRAGSRDKFFGKAHGEFKPIHEVDEGNCKMAARRAAMKEGVKVLFGLHHMDPKFLETHGVTLESAGGHTFKSQEDKVEWMQSLETTIADAKIGKMGETNGKKWTWYKVKTADGKDFSTFSETHFNTAKAALESKSKVLISFQTTEKGSVIKEIAGLAS
jgi:hypothetical protein